MAKTGTRTQAEDKTVQAVAKVAAEIHRQVRLATIPQETGPETGTQAYINLLGVIAGFFSAAPSVLDDLQSSGLITDQDYHDCHAAAMELCKKAQVAVQRQAIIDLRKAGADIPEDVEYEGEIDMVQVDADGNKRRLH